MRRTSQELLHCRRRVKQLEGMLNLPYPLIVGSSPRTDEHTPSSLYLEGGMPTYNVDHLIEHLEFRIMIHETYWGLVEDDPDRWTAFGSAEYHQWAIEGYKNAICYLGKFISGGE